MFETTQQRARERAQQAAQQTASGAKEEVGRRAFDTLEEYFPDQARERRRRDRLTMLAVGFAIGFAVGVLFGR